MTGNIRDGEMLYFIKEFGFLYLIFLLCLIFIFNVIIYFIIFLFNVDIRDLVIFYILCIKCNYEIGIKIYDFLLKIFVS